jgi:hypothetical protein
VTDGPPVVLLVITVSGLPANEVPGYDIRDSRRSHRHNENIWLEVESTVTVLSTHGTELV